MRTKTFDPKCYDLAAEFLADATNRNPQRTMKDQTNELAAYVQDCVEWFIAEYVERDPNRIADHAPLPRAQRGVE